MTAADRRLTYLGRQYTTECPVVITQEAISAYAAAIGWSATVNHSVPPTFAAVIANTAVDAVFEDPESGFILNHILHRSQRFVWVRPLRIGDAITAESTVKKIWPGRGSSLVEVAVRLLSYPSRETLCTVTMTWSYRDAGGPHQ